MDASYKSLMTAEKGKSKSAFSQVKASASVNIRRMTFPEEKNSRQTLEVSVHTFSVIRFP